jgi:predicted lysophospholipase L1 biosynthesis ABC-type transport system permease subunit
MVVVSTGGASAAIERARTALEADFPYLGPPAVLTGSGSQSAYAALQRMTDVVILASLVIAGCSLAVSVAAGLTDRKRPFSLLRLAGAPLGMLRRVVALESAVPLVAIATLSAGAGFLASALFLRSELGESLRPPGGGYYLIVGIGLLASLAVIACTFPLLERITGPETARNE